MRNLGLDITRSIAIFLVVLAHGLMFFVARFHPGVSKLLNFSAVMGVEIFFVLSGFLIGQIILREVIEKPSFSNLRRFYLRRWLRTLPLYYLVLFIVFIIERKFYWQDLFFVQNFNKETLGFFPVSWSLVVEEWFYLLIPLLLLLVMILVGRQSNSPTFKKNLFFKSLLILTLILMVLRIIYILMYNPTWDEGIRRQFFLRLDSLSIGVIIAGIKFYFKDFYGKLANYSKIILLFSIVCFSILYAAIPWHLFVFNSLFEKTFLFDVISIACGCLIIAMETNKFVTNLQNNLVRKTLTFISLTSYSMYLIHYEIYHYFASKEIHNIDASLKYWMISSIIAICVAAVLYRFYEKPMMGLRDRNPWSTENKLNYVSNIEVSKSQ